MSLSKSDKIINTETSDSLVENPPSKLSTHNSNQRDSNSSSSSQNFFIFTVMSVFSIAFVYCLQFYYFDNVTSSTSNSQSFDTSPSPGYESVTYNSMIKLTHAPSGFKLHSQEAKYGTGSGQQVVSGLEAVNDRESYWLIYPSFKSGLVKAGVVIMCGDIVSLKHIATNAFLHSHKFASPLSDQQEVSGFNGHDTGDDWKVVCVDQDAKKTWKREKNIKLQHVDTGSYLASNAKHVFPHPISGQLEVFATNSDDKSCLWSSQEGIYFPEH